VEFAPLRELLAGAAGASPDEGTVGNGMVAQVAVDTYITAGMVNQGIVYEFTCQGYLPANIARLKDLYRPHLAAMLVGLERSLPGCQWTRPEGGFFVAVTLPAEATAERVAAGAEKEGLVLSSGGSQRSTPTALDSFGFRFARRVRSRSEKPRLAWLVLCGAPAPPCTWRSRW
jgi:hypothetical protein